MKIEILGSGCAKCNEVALRVEQAVRMSGMPVEVAKVEDIREIMSRGVLMTPAVVIDGKVRSMGTVPEVPQILSWIMTAAAESGS